MKLPVLASFALFATACTAAIDPASSEQALTTDPALYVGDYIVPFCAGGLPPATFSGPSTHLIGLTLHADGTFVARVPASTTRECAEGERCVDAVTGRYDLGEPAGPAAPVRRLFLRSVERTLELSVIRMASGDVMHVGPAPSEVTAGAVAATAPGGLLYPTFNFRPDRCIVCADSEELVSGTDRHCRARD